MHQDNARYLLVSASLPHVALGAAWIALPGLYGAVARYFFAFNHAQIAGALGAWIIWVRYGLPIVYFHLFEEATQPAVRFSGWTLALETTNGVDASSRRVTGVDFFVALVYIWKQVGIKGNQEKKLSILTFT